MILAQVTRIIQRRSVSTRIIVNEQFVRQRVIDGRENLVKNLKQAGRFRFTKPPKNAAVVVPLCEVDGRLSILYTLRTPGLYSHGGQVSFPGGKVDDDDTSPSHTALRECEEELGITPDKVDVWAELQGVPDRAGVYFVTPVLCFINKLDFGELNPSREEVQDVFTVPMTHLLLPSNQGYTTFRNEWTMPVFCNCKHQIWGMTAIFTEILLANAFSDVYKMNMRVPDKKKKMVDRWL